MAWWSRRRKPIRNQRPISSWRGARSEQTGEWDLAVMQYEKALAIDKNSAPRWSAMRICSTAEGKRSKRLDYYVRAVKANPNDASVVNDLGLCYARQGKFRPALEYLGKAVELQPDRELYRNNIATVLVEVGRVDEAVSQIAAVYGEPIAHYNVGVLLKQQGKRQEAANQFARAIAQDPGMDDAREWLDRLNAEERHARNWPACRSPNRPKAMASARPPRTHSL